MSPTSLATVTPAAWADAYYDAYVFDMDGTVYLGDDVLPGAQRTIRELQARGIPVRFLSNNPTKTASQYVAKLSRLGIDISEHHIVSTVEATVRWLVANMAGATVFAIAERPLLTALAEAGIRQSDDPREIDVVIASYDRAFTYRKLQIAFDALRGHRGARLIATNPDRYCPLPGGGGEPDSAAVIAAIEACTAASCEVVVGKPNPLMLELAIGDLDIDPTRCLMVGDRLSTDIRMATDAGIDSALPLTGDSRREEAMSLPPAKRPTLIIDRLDQLLPRQTWRDHGWD
jgi:HAD superfamily hydrolase (TIGR01450 family)